MQRGDTVEARTAAPTGVLAASLAPRAAPWLFGLAYFVFAELGHALTLGGPGFATFWPAAGLYVSVLACLPPRRWPAFLVAAALANLASDVGFQGKPVGLGVAFLAANAAEATLAATLLQRSAGVPVPLASVRDALRLVFATVLVGASVGASLGSLAVHAAFATPIGDAWLTWWSADALGALLVAPALLGWQKSGRASAVSADRDRDAAAHALGLAIALTVAAMLFLRFGLPTPLSFVFLPPLLWAALRFGIAGGAVAMLVVAFTVVLGTRAGFGPFTAVAAAAHPFLIQSLLAAYALVALVVAAQFVERRRFEQRVLEANETLEQRVAERTEHLLASESRYRGLVELAPDPIFVNRGDRIVLANRAFLALVGATHPEAVLGRSPLDLIAPSYRDVARRRIRTLLATGQAQPAMEQTWLRLDGSEIEVEVSAALHEDPEGSGVQVLLRDITERRRVQRALAESEERLQLALHGARMFAFEWNPTTDAVVRSTESRHVIGMAGGEPDSGERYFAQIDAEDRQRLRRTVRQLVPGADTYRLVYRLRRPDGSAAILEESARGLFDEHGRLQRLVGIAFDVTEREAALTALRESENRFATVANALPAVLYSTDANGECDYVNPAFTVLTGCDATALRSEGWMTVVHPEDVPAMRRAWSESLARGTPFSLEYRLRRQDGTWRWFKGTSQPVRDDAGRVCKWIGVALDVDDQRRAQAALLDADRRKDEFLAMLAHELRNPLGPIRNAAAVLSALAPAEPRLRGALDIIGRQTAHLARLVDDLLDAARVTRGKIALAPVAIDVAQAIEAGLELARPALEARQQRLELALPDTPLAIEVDPTRFAQVIGNLLQNAAKFSPPGRTVQLAAAAEGDEAVIRVTDQGIGIAPEVLPHVFELFTQGDRSLDRRQGGLGIGLALVKAIVELHGGRVEARSGPEGSQLTVRLRRVPAAELAPLAPVGAQVSRATPRRVLVVEDNADAAESLVALLELHGHTVQWASHGQAALALVPELRPEVAILDIGLPVMDGYTLARLLRETPEARDCLLVALTGYGQPEDRARALAAGFDAHLVKPVEPIALERVLAEPRRPSQVAA